MSVTVAEIEVADPPDARSSAGFTVDPDAVCRVGLIPIRLVGGDDGIPTTECPHCTTAHSECRSGRR